MRIPRVLGGGLAAVVLSAAWLVAGPGIRVAGANCIGPQLQVAPTVAAPGQSITVTGLHFGDDCNDTGRPGPVLGQPLQDIELSVRIGSRADLVAVVDAGTDYAFSVEIVVPPSLGTGAGQVVVGSSGTFASSSFASLVIEGSPVRSEDAPIVEPDEPGAVLATDGPQARAWDWPWPLAVGAVGGVVVTFVGLALVRHRPR